MRDWTEIAALRYPGRSYTELTDAEQEECIKEFATNFVVGAKLVLHDQGGRNHARFCKIVKRTPCYMTLQQVAHRSVDLNPDVIGYRSIIEYQVFPDWEEDDEEVKPFKRKVTGDEHYTIYDEEKKYIHTSYD